MEKMSEALKREIRAANAKNEIHIASRLTKTYKVGQRNGWLAKHPTMPHLLLVTPDGLTAAGVV